MIKCEKYIRSSILQINPAYLTCFLVMGNL